MSLTQKSFKELSEMLEVIAHRFFAAKKMHLIAQQDTINENDFDVSLPYDAYLLKVEEAYQSLDEREKNLINNEFFFQNYRYWWTSLYSKTSFYRFKRRAMLRFLEVFYYD